MGTPHILSSLRDGIVVMASGPMIAMATDTVARLRTRAVPVEFQALDVRKFNYAETHVELQENVRGKTVILFHGFTNKPNDDLMSMLLICDAIRRSHARSIILMTPFLPYTRQDRVQSREPFSAKLIAQMIELNPIIEQMITMDLHVEQIAGFYDKICVENIPGHALFVPHIREHYRDVAQNLTVVSTDVGGSKRARNLAEQLNASVAIIDKRHDDKKGSKALSLIGDVKRHVILYDDIGDSMSSLISAAAMIRGNAHVEHVDAYISHALLSPKGGTTAEQKLKEANLNIVAADTFPRSDAYLKQNPTLKLIPTAPFWADIIMALICVNGSIKKTIVHWTDKKTFA